jgi:hypothetical protein
MVWAGFLMQVGRDYAFSADNTTNISTYKNRIWVLRGVDYNTLLDRRVWRNTADYLHQIALPGAGGQKDGTILKNLLTNYADLSGFDVTTEVDDITYPINHNDPSVTLYVQQGLKIRETMKTYAMNSGAVYYFRPDKKFVWKSLESVQKNWGFSDQPNGTTTIGPRDMDSIEDGLPIVNDALEWGGSEWAGSGGTVFAREENLASQSAHGRWQMGETHFGEDGMGIQAGVDARAAAIVNGPPGANALGQEKGLRFAQWSFSITWWAHDVPLVGGVPDHLRVGDLVTISMAVFGVTKVLPLRRLTISFPNLDKNGNGIAQFKGDFGLQVSDPYTLWRFLLGAERRARVNTFSALDNTSSFTVYGAAFQGSPVEAPNGSRTVFHIKFGYINNLLSVYKNGLLLSAETDYTQSNPETGEFTMAVAPASTDKLYVLARTLQA